MTRIQPSPTPRAADLAALLPELLRLAIHITRDRSIAEDLVQDVALKLWSRLQDGSADPVEDLRAYALSALRNRIRRTAPRPAAPPAKTADTPGPDPDATVRLACSQAIAALDSLPPEQSLLIRMRAIEGLSYAEIARRLGLPEGTVTSRLSRARASLRRALDLPPGAPVIFLID